MDVKQTTNTEKIEQTTNQTKKPSLLTNNK